MDHSEYDALFSIADIVDRLCVELQKCAHANHSILDERRKASPNVEAISHWEWVARSAGEQRVRLKNLLNRRVDDAIRRGGFQTAPEARTYDLRGL